MIGEHALPARRGRTHGSATPSVAHLLEELKARPLLDSSTPALRVTDQVVDDCRSVLHRMGGAELTSVGVSSARRGEGRSTLAEAIAVIQRCDFGRCTLLVDLDLEREPSPAARRLRTGPGLTELLRGDARIEHCLQWLDDGLAVLPAGDPPGPPGWVVGHLQQGDLMAQIAYYADVVIADLPPLLDCSVGAQAAALFDTHLLVVRAGSTTPADATAAAAALPGTPYAVLNGYRSAIPRWLRRLRGDSG